MRVLGLMSGTSADGIDAVMAEFAGNPAFPKWNLLDFFSLPYPVDLSRRLVDAGQGKKLSSEEWLDLTEEVTELFAEAALTCDPAGYSELVGCHGQTVWHRPPSIQSRGASLQLLQAPLLAQILKCPVIHDFRAADLAVGGQGAPLLPTIDAAIFQQSLGWRAILNLGGIANISLIPPINGPDSDKSVVGWDCGPANTLIDFAVQKTSDGEFAFDRDGLIAARGVADEQAIKRWLKEPFFHSPPPKSTGREKFGLSYLDDLLKELFPISQETLIATLTAFTAAVVAQDFDNLDAAGLVRPIEMLLAGGGCRNPVLVNEIARRCRGIRVCTTDEYGMPIQAREAFAFALLAWWHIHEYRGNSPHVTGAEKSIVLGVRVNPG